MWAGSDLFSKMGTNPKDKYSHLRIVIVVGLVMGIHALFEIITSNEVYNPINMVKYFPVSILYILSMTLGYAGLRYIELSVSSPICNSSGAIVVILCFFILKETMSAFQAVAVAIICVGVVGLGVLEKRYSDQERALAGHEPEVKYSKSAVAILLPVAYCILDALGTFADALVLEGDVPMMTEFEANTSYELTFFVAAVVAYIYLVFVRKQTFRLFKEKIFIAGAVCETIGQFFYVFALAANPIIAAPVIASYSVGSVLLSRIVLKEKLKVPQYIVVALVLIGIAMLGVLDGLAEA